MSDTPPHAPRLLIASHHAEAGLALKELGEKNGYTVLRCFTATQALERARTTRPDVIALDDSLLDADPLETSRALRDRKSTRLNSKSPCNLVCRLLLEKKKNNKNRPSKRDSVVPQF